LEVILAHKNLAMRRRLQIIKILYVCSYSFYAFVWYLYILKN
jgi:hypothetical protein